MFCKSECTYTAVKNIHHLVKKLYENHSNTKIWRTQLKEIKNNNNNLELESRPRRLIKALSRTIGLQGSGSKMPTKLTGQKLIATSFISLIQCKTFYILDNHLIWSRNGFKRHDISISRHFFMNRSRKVMKIRPWWCWRFGGYSQ